VLSFILFCINVFCFLFLWQVHPQGRKLIVLTKRSRLCALDLKLFGVSHNYPGVLCGVHPLKLEVHPPPPF
jgi:hypothetical protein